MISLEYFIELFALRDFLFFLWDVVLYKNFKNLFKHMECIIPYEGKNLPFFLTFFGQRFYDSSQSII